MNLSESLCCALLMFAGIARLFAQTYFIKSEDFQFHCGWEFTRFVGNNFLWARSPEAQTAFTAVDFSSDGDFAVWANTSDNPSNNPGTRTHEVLLDGKSLGIAGTHGKNGFAWQRLSDVYIKAGVHLLGIKKIGSHARSRFILFSADKSFDPSNLTEKELEKFRLKPVKADTSYKDMFPRPQDLKDAKDAKPEVLLENADVKISFKPMLLPDGKTIAYKRFASAKKNGVWSSIFDAEKEMYVLLFSRDVNASDGGYYASWKGGEFPSLKTFISAGGKTAETSIAVENPYRAAEAVELLIKNVEKISDNSARLIFYGGAEAVFELSKKGTSCGINFAIPAEKDGFYSVGVLAFESVPQEKVNSLFLPAVYQGRTIMTSPKMLTDSVVSNPLSIVEKSLDGGDSVYFGISADPSCLPFSWPEHGKAIYGFSLCDSQGIPRAAAFSPVLGVGPSKKKAGETFHASFKLFGGFGDWRDALELANTDIFAGAAFREAYDTSLSDAVCNMAELLSDTENSGWSAENKARWNIEVKYLVALACPLAEVESALLSADEEHYRNIALPTIEYSLSRKGRHYAPRSDEEFKDNGYGKKAYELEVPSRSYSADYYYSLDRLLGGKNPWLKKFAKIPSPSEHEKNFYAIPSWSVRLGCYLADPNSTSLEQIKKDCDIWIKNVFHKPLTPEIDLEYFVNVGYYPYWWYLPEMYEITGDRKYLDYAEQGAFFSMASMWNFPTPPSGKITLYKNNLLRSTGEYTHEDNTDKLKRGREQSEGANLFISNRGLPRCGGFIFMPQKSVDAMKVSRIGLGIEQHTTCSIANWNILMPSWANEMLRTSKLCGRDILEKFSRHAIIGRFGNFPGYYLTDLTDIQHDPLYPYKGPDATSFYWHHAPAHFAQSADYLFTQFEFATKGKVKFPFVRQQGYAWFTDRIYSMPGTVFGHDNLKPLLDKRAANISDAKISKLSAVGSRSAWLLLLNDSASARSVKFRLNSLSKTFSRALPESKVDIFSPEGNLVSSCRFLEDIELDMPAQSVFGIRAELAPDNGAKPDPAPLGADAHQFRKTAGNWGEAHFFRIRSPFGKDSIYALLTGGWKAPQGSEFKLYLSFPGGEKDIMLSRGRYPYEISVYPIPQDKDVKICAEIISGGKTIWKSGEILIKSAASADDS